jgi:hypothetical protein
MRILRRAVQMVPGNRYHRGKRVSQTSLFPFRRLKQRIHLLPGALHSITAIFRASAAITNRSALSPAGCASFGLAYPTLLIKFLLARSQRKRLATASTFNLLVCHLELILLSLPVLLIVAL